MSGIPASTLDFSINMLGVDVALQWMGQLQSAFGGAAQAAVDTYAQTELNCFITSGPAIYHHREQMLT